MIEGIASFNQNRVIEMRRYLPYLYFVMTVKALGWYVTKYRCPLIIATVLEMKWFMHIVIFLQAKYCPRATSGRSSSLLTKSAC